MRTLKYLFAYSIKQKPRVHQLDFIGGFLQENFNNKVFVKLDSKYADYFTEYSNYFGISLSLFKSMYLMTNSGNLFSDEFTDCLIESVFVQSQ